MSSEHGRFLAKRGYAIPDDVDLTGFASDELTIIKRYGHWMDALERKTLFPSTEAQRHFLSVCYGQEKPVTEFEVAWRKLKDALAVAAEKSAKCLSIDARGKRAAREKRAARRRLEQERNLRNANPQSPHPPDLTWIPLPERERPNSWNTCPICGGDGGAKGECFKCSGTGWI